MVDGELKAVVTGVIATTMAVRIEMESTVVLETARMFVLEKAAGNPKVLVSFKPVLMVEYCIDVVPLDAHFLACSNAQNKVFGKPWVAAKNGAASIVALVF